MIFAISSQSKRGEREQRARIAIAEIAQEVRLDVGAGEEIAVDSLVVEARHRPAIEPQRPRRHDQIGAFQRAVAEGGVENFLVVALEPALGVGVRKQLGQVVIEVEVVADDGAHRRLHGLVAIAFGEIRLQALFGLA